MKHVFFAAMAAILAVTPCIAAGIPEIGGIPPSISLVDIQNKPVDVSALYGEKPLILTFFASWSKSCSSQMYAVNKLYKEYKSKGLKVAAISFDKKTVELEKFIEENGIDFQVLLDKKLKSIDKYAILIIPTTFFIDKNGKIASIIVDYNENSYSTLKNLISNELEK